MKQSYEIITKKLKESMPNYEEKMIYNPDLMRYERRIDFEKKLENMFKIKPRT